MPMVSAPAALATSATTGPAPVPVPPPSPRVMNTMSAPLRTSSISLRWSSAAWRPISGSEPAPRPRVMLAADVELHVGVAHEQGLRVGVHRDELDALQPGVDHPVDGVAAAAADPDDLDHRQVVLRLAQHQLRPLLEVLECSSARVWLVIPGPEPTRPHSLWRPTARTPGISGLGLTLDPLTLNLQSRFRVMSSCTSGPDFTLAPFDGQLPTSHTRLSRPRDWSAR